MSANDGVVDVVVCLGSSCFARGNSEVLAMLQQYAQKSGSNPLLHLAGCLCQDQCKQGPNLKIGDEFHHNITATSLRELLRGMDGLSEGTHGET